ncbi:MAG: hypothetical protein AAF411_02685 [Myxococcota bacterium]
MQSAEHRRTAEAEAAFDAFLRASDRTVQRLGPLMATFLLVPGDHRIVLSFDGVYLRVRLANLEAAETVSGADAQYLNELNNVRPMPFGFGWCTATRHYVAEAQIPSHRDLPPWERVEAVLASLPSTARNFSERRREDGSWQGPPEHPELEERMNQQLVACGLRPNSDGHFSLSAQSASDPTRFYCAMFQARGGMLRTTTWTCVSREDGTPTQTSRPALASLAEFNGRAPAETLTVVNSGDASRHVVHRSATPLNWIVPECESLERLQELLRISTDHAIIACDHAFSAAPAASPPAERWGGHESEKIRRMMAAAGYDYRMVSEPFLHARFSVVSVHGMEAPFILDAPFPWVRVCIVIPRDDVDPSLLHTLGATTKALGFGYAHVDERINVVRIGVHLLDHADSGSALRAAVMQCLDIRTFLMGRGPAPVQAPLGDIDSPRLADARSALEAHLPFERSSKGLAHRGMDRHGRPFNLELHEGPGGIVFDVGLSKARDRVAMAAELDRYNAAVLTGGTLYVAEESEDEDVRWCWTCPYPWIDLEALRRTPLLHVVHGVVELIRDNPGLQHLQKAGGH